jgi:hypothetical protein
MPTWLKAVLGILGVIAVFVLALGGTGAYFVFSNLDQRELPEAESVKAMEATRARFGQRPPLIEIANPKTMDVRVNRPDQASSTPVDTIHIINWKRENDEFMTTSIPLWLMRFSSVNILSQLGVAPARFRLTVEDIERYGPGIIVDYSVPGEFRLLLWVD